MTYFQQRASLMSSRLPLLSSQDPYYFRNLVAVGILLLLLCKFSSGRLSVRQNSSCFRVARYYCYYCYSTKCYYIQSSIVVVSVHCSCLHNNQHFSFIDSMKIMKRGTRQMKCFGNLVAPILLEVHQGEEDSIQDLVKQWSTNSVSFIFLEFCLVYFSRVFVHDCGSSFAFD